jgi:hypothetical protein
MLDLFSEVPFPSFVKGKLSTKTRPDKAVSGKNSQGLTGSALRRTSTA